MRFVKSRGSADRRTDGLADWRAGILYPFRPFPAVWVEISGRRHWESLPFRLIFAIWVEISGRRHWDSLPFRLIFSVWVEISQKRHQDSLPFSADFCCLGRDFWTVAPGFSTHMRNIGNLGRDFPKAASGFSTFSVVFRCLGRNSQADSPPRG